MQVTLTIPDELAAYQCLLDLASEADEREGQLAAEQRHDGERDENVVQLANGSGHGVGPLEADGGVNEDAEEAEQQRGDGLLLHFAADLRANLIDGAGHEVGIREILLEEIGGPGALLFLGCLLYTSRCV